MLISELDFLIGGGVFPYSIGAIFSYDTVSHITTGCIMSGRHIPKWSKEIPGELRDIYNPLIIPVFMAEILRDKALVIRQQTLNEIRDVEDGVEAAITRQTEVSSTKQNERNQNSQQNSNRDYGVFSLQLSHVTRFLGVFQVLIERIDLYLKFAVEEAKDDLMPQIPPGLDKRIKLMQSFLKYMRADYKKISARHTCLIPIVTGLVTQRDVILTHQIAAETRRDGVVVKIIAGLGAVFLPATVIAVRLISL